MAITWVAAASVGGIVLVLLAAPAMDVRLTQRTTNPLTIAAVLFILALVINSIGAKTGPQDFTESLSVIFVGLGLLFTVLACVRFALS